MKGQLNISVCILMTCLVLGLSTTSSRAFALLGPFESWMQATNGVREPGDIGGPMDITNEYRWNVPVLTYGFDQSFLNYFGTNGVTAVASAIQILNNLPPASQIVLTNYPVFSQRINYGAQSQGLYDLKSQTLALLLEQMGLAQPTRYIFVLKQWTPAFETEAYEADWIGWAVPDYIVQRNFDPQTLLPSSYVNRGLYDALVISASTGNLIENFPADPTVAGPTTVADSYLALNTGTFFTGLTYDDVGGLSYLLSTNNINLETLLPGVYGVGTNAGNFVNGAWRPGVDKITFVSQPVCSQSGAFMPMTNFFTDSYVTNGILKKQQVARVIPVPDVTFSAGALTSGTAGTPFFVRTGTSNWIDNATVNGNTNGAGPGVIQPPVQILFNKLGPQFSTDGAVSDEEADNLSSVWGSFDATTNAPVAYPSPQTGTNQLALWMWLWMGNPPNWSTHTFEWTATSATMACS